MLEVSTAKICVVSHTITYVLVLHLLDSRVSNWTCSIFLNLQGLSLACTLEMSLCVNKPRKRLAQTS